jgi:hypothetical protein
VRAETGQLAILGVAGWVRDTVKRGKCNIMMVHVQVTSEDIENGVRRDGWKCPVALALFRATGVKYSVGRTVCRQIGQPGRNLLPTEIRAWTAAFDSGQFPKPMEFEIEINVPTVADVVRD